MKKNVFFLLLIGVFALNIGVADAADYKLGSIEIQARSGSACGAPSYIALEKGFFAEEGLDVTLVAGNFETQKAGLASGKFYVANGDFNFFPSIVEGLDLKIIAGLHEGCIKLIVPPDSTIKEAKDLKGKTIGVDQIGGTPFFVASLVLAEAGLNAEKDVKWRPYPLDQLSVAVGKGEIDAYAAWDPFGSLAVRDQNYKVISDIATDPLFAGRFCCFLYASNKKIKDEPEKIQAILRAYNKAIDWIGKNPEEAAKIEIDKGYVKTTDYALLTQLLSEYKYHGTQHLHGTGSPSDPKADAYYFASKLKNAGFFKGKDLDVEKWIDGVYYDALGTIKK
jgi:NitT/TauT family transport system substrate-binding protein